MSVKLGLSISKSKKVIWNDPAVLMEGSELMDGSWYMEDQAVGQKDIDIKTGEDGISVAIQTRP